MEQAKTLASDELLTEQLKNRDWNAFWLRLVARCAWLLRKRYTVTWPNSQLKTFCRNAVAEVIDKIFVDKVRQWNLEAYPEFERFIVSALDSHVNNTLNKKSSEILTDGTVFNDKNDNLELSPEDHIISKELRDELFAELQKAGADDNELLIFECMAEGIYDPENIKAEIGMDDREFHNTFRRFKRKRDLIKKKLAANGI